MRPAIREWLAGYGFKLIDPLVAWTLDGVAWAGEPAGQVWVAVSAKARAKPADIKAFRRLLERPSGRASGPRVWLGPSSRWCSASPPTGPLSGRRPSLA